MIDRQTIEEYLLVEHSKSQNELICDLIDGNPKSFRAVWNIMKTGEPLLAQRASWVFGQCVDRKPSLIEPLFAEVFDQLKIPDQHPAVIRHLLRSISIAERLPEDAGHLYDHCLELVGDPSQAVAARVYGMEIASRIALPYPELHHEILELIDQHFRAARPAFKARAKHIRLKLAKAALR